jgi:hypothetical protein
MNSSSIDVKSEELEALLSKMSLTPSKPIGTPKRAIPKGKKPVTNTVIEVEAEEVYQIVRPPIEEVKVEVVEATGVVETTVDKAIAVVDKAIATVSEATVDKAIATVSEASVDKAMATVSEAKPSILSFEHWKHCKAFQAIQAKETQIKYYQRMKAADEVLQLVALDSKPFGSECEKILTEIFGLGPRTSTQNDGTFNGKKIEIKTARYWAGQDNCVWQHLEPDHDYEYALFVLLDFQGWKVWGIKKSLLMGELRDKKVVTFQGKQGWWTRKTAILEYLTPITSVLDLQGFIV